MITKIIKKLYQNNLIMKITQHVLQRIICILSTRYEVGRIVGEGSSGIIFEITDKKETNLELVCKVSQNYEYYITEVKLM